MTYTIFKLGDRVRWHNSADLGTVEKRMLLWGEEAVKVQWDNGVNSTPRPRDLRLVAEATPTPPIIQDEAAITLANLESRKSAKVQEIAKASEKIVGLETQVKNLRESIERKMVEQSNIEKQITHITNL